MFPPLILGILFLIGLLFLIRWYISTDVRIVKRKLKYLFLLILLVFFIFLAVTGRLAAAFGVFMAIITFGRRVFGLISILNWVKNFFRVSPSIYNNTSGAYEKKKSYVQTKFLNMTLDHESGELDGLIILGSLKGKLLSNLNLDDLIGFRHGQVQGLA